MKVIPLLAIETLAACSSVTEPSGQTAQVSCDREVATGTTIAVKKCRTAEQVFMPLTGTWSIQWGDQGENELTLGQWDVVSVPTGIMRGFRNESAGEAYMLAIVGGDDPGRVAWASKVMSAVRDKGFDLDDRGKIVEVTRARRSATD